MENIINYVTFEDEFNEKFISSMFLKMGFFKSVAKIFEDEKECDENVVVW